MRVVDNSVLVVPPFDCAWLGDQELKFAEAGRGCVAFEACADNDVTIVFKEQAGCKHYRTDCDPNYTVILGSHRNRRFKIEANGGTVVDVAGCVLSPSVFERYWISVDNGTIVVGKGEPGKGRVYTWVDCEPNRKVQYVGLSSWDKHVSYRNIRVLQPIRSHLGEAQEQRKGSELSYYLERSDLADMKFIIGPECTTVPAHRILLASCCPCFPNLADVIRLPSVKYEVLHCLLEYMYVGRTHVLESHLSDLQEIAAEFGIERLAQQCEKLGDALNAGSIDIGDDGQHLRLEVEFTSPKFHQDRPALFIDLPVDASLLMNFYSSGDLSDVELLLEDGTKPIRAHKLILSAWSLPFAKMFTNGMSESSTTQVYIKDADFEAFEAMIKYMYSGSLGLEKSALLLPLLLLADRFGVSFLQQECCDKLLEHVNEDSACAILRVAATIANNMPASEMIRDACEECCARHFDYCVTSAAGEFKELEPESIGRILQHSDLLVTSEERVFDAVLMWGLDVEGTYGWEEVAKLIGEKKAESIFHSRFEGLKMLLPLVRFPLMPLGLLEKIISSHLGSQFTIVKDLVNEALDYLTGDMVSGCGRKISGVSLKTQGRLVTLPKSSLRFSRRASSLKQLMYICDGDHNGVLYYAGTSYGVHYWMNPVLLKHITISASSPPSRYTDPKILASRNYQATSFAGPCLAECKFSAWWKIDLGAEHQLMCNYYSVRQDGSSSFMRSWIFQGSPDDVHWTDLSIHRNDSTICSPGQYGSWPVCGKQSLLPFRFFRILLTGPTTCSSSLWNLSLCYIELYGCFQ